MIHQVTTTLAITLAFGFSTALSADALPIDELPQDHEVLFSRDIAPILKKNCIACHNASNEEGGVNLESAATMKSSDVEDVLVPGKPDASRLFLVASHADEPVMPPVDNDVSALTLSPMELALLRRWIRSGAVVDQVTNEPSVRTWQPLPASLRTVYASAMTADGRLSAVSFGNRIHLFGKKSAQPIEALEIDSGEQSNPAHDDFVQDLFLDPTGRHVVSAGFRHVKLWEMAPFESTSIPEINGDDVVSLAVNASGRHLAVLSRRGELSVAEIGTDRWQWKKNIELPDEVGHADSPKIHLAIGAGGHAAAVGWGNTIRIVRIDGENTETIDMADAVTSILWRGKHDLAMADSTGRVIFGKRDGGAWVTTGHSVFDQPVLGLYSAAHPSKRLIAMDASGKVANWNEANGTFEEVGRLPAPAASASLSPSGSTLWVASAAGTLGQYIIANEKFVEVAKSDPVAEARLAADSWQTLVGEKRVAAHDNEVKQAQEDVEAEKQSLQTLDKQIETETKRRDEGQANVAEAKKAAEVAATKLVEARSAQQTINQQRNDLAKSVKQLGAEIAKLEARLAKLQQEHADAKNDLAAMTDAKKLADAVKAATEAAVKADQAVANTEGELSTAVMALGRAEEAKTRGESRLKGLSAKLQRQQQAFDQSKANQRTRKSTEAASKTMRDQSRATDRSLALMAAGTRLVTRSGNSDGETSGTWSLWSSSGDWLAPLSDIPAGGQLVASGDQVVLIKGTDGKMQALKNSDRLWQHRKTIGASTGPSPFADRVLSVDVDPTGNLLATGGGEASRMGELMIWRVSDGSLIRKIETPHEDTVLCVRFSPDGKTLASGGADRMVRLWNVESGKLIKTLEGHTHHVTSIAWNIHRRQLASGSADATVKIWDTDSGQSQRTISGLKTEVTRLVFVGRDERVGVAGGDSHFRVYRTDNGARETNAEVLGGYLYAMDSNRDGSRFVVGGADGVAVVVDQSGQQLMEYTSEAD